MSILHLGTQDSLQDCYLPNGEMNKDKLNEHIKDFDQKYSYSNPAMTNMVHTLL